MSNRLLVTLFSRTDLDACANGIPCPSEMDHHTIPFLIDLSRDSSSLNLLKDDAPYQMKQVLENRENGNRVVSCMT